MRNVSLFVSFMLVIVDFSYGAPVSSKDTLTSTAAADKNANLKAPAENLSDPQPASLQSGNSMLQSPVASDKLMTPNAMLQQPSDENAMLQISNDEGTMLQSSDDEINLLALAGEGEQLSAGPSATASLEAPAPQLTEQAGKLQDKSNLAAKTKGKPAHDKGKGKASHDAKKGGHDEKKHGHNDKKASHEKAKSPAYGNKKQSYETYCDPYDPYCHSEEVSYCDPYDPHCQPYVYSYY